MTKPDFKNFTGKQLVEALNTYTGTRRTARFASKAKAIAAVEAAWSKTAQVEGKRNDETTVIVFKAPDCPYHRGVVAKKHYAKAQGSHTVAEYLNRFPKGEARSYAQAWLRLFIRQGHIALKS
jgi:hypothetical protein